jgi:hypothetical protein
VEAAGFVVALGDRHPGDREPLSRCRRNFELHEKKWKIAGELTTADRQRNLLRRKVVFRQL